MRPAIVAVVPAQCGGEPLVLRGQWRVHEPPGVLAQRRQLARQAFPFRLVLHDEPAISGPPAVVGEAEEGEGLWSPLAAPLTRDGREPAKLDQPRLALMKHQAKAGQPHLEGQEHFLRICLALEAHDEVVRIAHGHDATAGMTTTPLVGPEIEDVVQEDVGKERADACPLRRAPVRLSLLAALKNTGPQPQLEEP